MAVACQQNYKLTPKTDSFTWAWFTFPLSTAGISLLLAGTPNRFTGLTTIGKIFFILSIVLYLIALALIAVRFITDPKSLRCSLMHPLESLFFPTVLLTCELP
jgi:tellurite resistance protein TehA-like permease